MPRCALCEQQSDRVLNGRVPLCLQDYSDARVGRLPDDKARKLKAIWNTSPAEEPPAPKRRGPAAEEAASTDEPEDGGQLADRKGGD